MPSSWGDDFHLENRKEKKKKTSGQSQGVQVGLGIPGWTETKRLAEGLQEALMEKDVRRLGWVPPALQWMVMG